jgi:hypothetical protein
MSDYISNLNNVNKAKNQQHPFHLLASSRLPIFMAAFAGGLAISVIIKLQNISNVVKFSTVGAMIMEPFFSVTGALPSTELPDSIIDSRILLFLTLIILTM